MEVEIRVSEEQGFAPDLWDEAEVVYNEVIRHFGSFRAAEGKAAIARALARRSAPAGTVGVEEPPEVALLRGPLSKRATSAEFNEWQAREVVYYIDRLRALVPSTSGTAAMGIEMAAKAGWNACRKSIYALCENMQEKPFSETGVLRGVMTERQEAHGEGFNAGWKHAGKSVARTFNSMEAEDDDNFATAIRALAPEGEVGWQPTVAELANEMWEAMFNGTRDRVPESFDDAALTMAATALVGGYNISRRAP